MSHDVSMNDGHPTDIVCETDNGCVTRCNHCEVIYLEFGNIIVKLAPQKFGDFKSAICNLDYERMESNNAHLNLRRRIVIQIEKTNITIILNRQEYFELIELMQLTEICLSSES